MVTRQRSPSFFLRYQALIRPPGPPPTIARSSIDFCYLPAKLRRPDRHATCPRLRIACQTERGAERQKIPPRSRDSERQFDVFGRQRGELRLRRQPPFL